MIQYIGEWYWASILGKALIASAFLFALASAFIFLSKALRERKSLHPGASKIGCIFYSVHVTGVVFAVGLLFLLIFRHRFEFLYVWQYTSTDLPAYFLFSSFWAGQEGSFMLWALFQGLLGIILMRTSGKWQAGAMGIYALAQSFVLSALLGFDAGILQIGKSPFVLFRQTVESIEGTLFARPDYLQFLTEGNGMNPLLENIWMVIHPPALFLGYASILAPYSLGVAALIRRKPYDFIPVILPWVIFSVLSLGIGILLGGMWAYVSLTFGGFWAWDPVENASYIPWISLVVTLHLLIVARKRQKALLMAFIFTFLSYILVLYASLLTRSGILGDTSVHAFGENGLLGQLTLTLVVFTFIPFVLILRRHKLIKTSIPENTKAREFWMVIGSLIMALGAFQVGVVTSLPVINKIFGTQLAPPTDPVAYYNAWQMPFAIMMALLMGISSYMAYRDTSLRTITQKTMRSAGIAFLLAFIVWVAYFRHIPLWFLYLFAAWFLIIASLDVMFKLIRSSVNPAGMLSHLGIGLFLLGLLITFGNSKVISRNTSRMSIGDTKTNQEHQILFRGDTVPMGDYFAVYESNQEKGREIFYTIRFLKKKEQGYAEAFTVYPSVNRNEKMGYVYNPSTHNRFLYDIYTYISFAQDEPGFFSLLKEAEIRLNDTLTMKNHKLLLDSLAIESQTPTIDPANVSVIAFFQLLDTTGVMIDTTRAAFVISDGIIQTRDGNFEKAKIRISFRGISDNPGTIKVSAWEDRPDFIIPKVMINPYINLIWLGALLAFIGMAMAWYKRFRQIKVKFV